MSDLRNELLQTTLRSCESEYADQWMAFTNADYYRQLADFLREREFFVPIGFAMENRGHTRVTDVRVQIELEASTRIMVADSTQLSKRPAKSLIGSFYGPAVSEGVAVARHADRCTITLQFGKLLPSMAVWSADNLYVGAVDNAKVDLGARVYWDEMSKPLNIPLHLDIAARRRELTLDKLYEAARDDDAQ